MILLLIGLLNVAFKVFNCYDAWFGICFGIVATVGYIALLIYIIQSAIKKYAAADKKV